MRAFIAIELDEPIKKGLARLQDQLRGASPGLRWVKPEQIHLTVAFLGEVKDSQIESISRAIGAATSATSDFDFGIEGLGVFPQRGRVNVLWVGISDEGGRLNDCHRALYEQLGHLGFAPDRGHFSPHLTLARVKDFRASHNLREIVTAQRSPRLGTQQAGSLTFFESTLGSVGPQHRVLSHHEFDGRPDARQS